MPGLTATSALHLDPAPIPGQGAFRVTLIGTGTPVPTPDRFGPATLVEAGDQKLLFDAGRGATMRLFQLGIPLHAVGPLFLTHFHSDHTVGIPDLWLSGWLPGPWARRRAPFHVIGPTGTKDLMGSLERAFAADIRIRMADENLPHEGIAVIAEEFDHEAIVFDQSGVRVTCFEVDHGEEIKPAFGYRIAYEGRSVVISGDTRFCQNVIRYGTGADVLIHAVRAVRPELANDPAVRLVMAHHASPQEAGRVFNQARPKLAAYTHLVLLSRPGVPALTVAEVVSQTREAYDGPLEVGADLTSFDIYGDEVIVNRAPAAASYPFMVPGPA
jgi:ribonuclease Z